MGWVNFTKASTRRGDSPAGVEYIEDVAFSEDEDGVEILIDGETEKERDNKRKGRLSGNLGGKIIGFKDNYIDRIANFELEKNLDAEARAIAITQLDRLYEKFKEEDKSIVD
jgi:hypothetical protein